MKIFFKFLKLIKYLYRLGFQPRFITNYGVKIDLSDVILKKYKNAFYLNSWESSEIRLLSKYIEKNDRVLEIGSCTGFLSTFASKIITSENVLAIEANPRMINVINSLRKLNSVSFKVINCIVSKRKEVDFYLNKEIHSSSIEKRINSKNKIKIPCITLEEIYKKFKYNFLLLDIEGNEYELLLNNKWPSKLNKILIEFHGIRKHSGLQDNFYNEVSKKLSKNKFVEIASEGRVKFFQKK